MVLIYLQPAVLAVVGSLVQMAKALLKKVFISDCWRVLDVCSWFSFSNCKIICRISSNSNLFLAVGFASHIALSISFRIKNLGLEMRFLQPVF